MHTTASDGLLSPEILVDEVQKCGLAGFAITDHDTINGYSEKMIQKAKSLGLALGSGIELSCHFKETSVHVLGYDFPLDAKPILDYCLKQKERRAKRNRAILERLKKFGIIIDLALIEELEQKHSSVGRPHIAQILVDQHHVDSIVSAFKTYLGSSGKAFIAGDYFPVEEAINVLHASGAKAFIAHPHLIVRKKVLRSLLTFPFDGMECYYGRMLPEQERVWIDRAKEKGWLISGGSDFHGVKQGPFSDYAARLGSSWVCAATFETIFCKHRIL